MQGIVKGLIESAPDKHVDLRRPAARTSMAGNSLTGTPEQIADELAGLGEAGVDGINIVYVDDARLRSSTSSTASCRCCRSAA